MSYLLNAYLNSSAKVDLLNATHDVKRALRDSQAKEGLLTVLIPGGGAGVVVLENAPEIQEAYKNHIINQIEESSGARPQRKSGSGHESAHLRAALMPTSVVIPIKDGKLLIGPWQEVIVIDFDDKVGRREVLIHILGEAPPPPNK